MVNEQQTGLEVTSALIATERFGARGRERYPCRSVYHLEQRVEVRVDRVNHGEPSYDSGIPQQRTDSLRSDSRAGNGSVFRDPARAEPSDSSTLRVVVPNSSIRNTRIRSGVSSSARHSLYGPDQLAARFLIRDRARLVHLP